MDMQELASKIIDELKRLHKKDPLWTEDVEKKVAILMKTNPELVLKKNEKIVWDVYEDMKMRQSIDKVNFVRAKEKEQSSYISKTSKIGRVNRKKALFDMTWLIKQNASRLNNKELMHFINEAEKELRYPEDYDIMQTAKIREDIVFLMNGKLNFHTLENGKNIKKEIKLIDNSIIVLGRNYVLRINGATKEIEDDKINAHNLLPLDSVYYVKGNFVFILKK